MNRDELSVLQGKLMNANGNILNQNFKDTYYLPLTPKEIEMLAQVLYSYMVITRDET